jgi:acetyltransferase-like isoleucine patch superfamily enzyme
VDFFSRDELLALGFAEVGEDTRVSRRAIFYASAGRIGDRVRVDDMAIFTGHVELGDDVHISPFCFLGGTGGKIVMGARSGISTHVSIFTKSDDYRANADEHAAKVTGDVSIGDNTIFGAQCVILPGSTVGANCRIGVGCVVTGEVAPASRVVSAAIKTVKLV